MLRISKRLARLASYVPIGARTADIGTDHALLPVFLVRKKISPYVIAVDVHEKPVQAARKNIRFYGAEGSVELRRGDGLTVLRPCEAEVLIAAGLGGGTIRDILAAVPEVANSLRRVILQPMTEAETLRLWLTGNNWLILEEDLILEDGRIFEIIVAEQGNPGKLSPGELFFGPRLLEKRHPLLKQFVEKEQVALQEILAQLAKSTTSEAEQRKMYFTKRILMIEELLQWLSVADR